MYLFSSIMLPTHAPQHFSCFCTNLTTRLVPARIGVQPPHVAMPMDLGSVFTFMFTLFPIVPVESVRFSTMAMDGIEKMAEEEEHEIILVEGVSLGLACTAEVNGSLDSPAVTVFRDTEDVSHLFVPTEQSRIMRSDEGPSYFFSEKKLRYDIHTPDPEWNDAELVCRARQTGFPDVTAKVTLKVQCKSFVN